MMSQGYTKDEVENAFIEALRPLSLEGGGYLRALGVHRGEFSADEFAAEALQAPAVFVAYASSTYSPGPYLHSCETLGFNVVVVCADGGSPDAYKVLADVREALCGATLGLDAAPVKLARETLLYGGRDVSVLAGLYSITQKVGMPSQGQNT